MPPGEQRGLLQPIRPTPEGEEPVCARSVADLVAATLPIPLFAVDPAGRIVHRNRAWWTFTGRAGGLSMELPRGVWPEEVFPDDRAVLGQRVLRGLETRSGFVAEFRLRRADGALRWMRGTAVAMRDRGEFRGLVCACVDVTDGKRLLQHLSGTRRRPSGELGTSPAASQWGRIVRGHRVFATGANTRAFTHRINNLLTGILGHTALARDRSSRGDLEPHLAEIERAVLQASELCSGMLLFSHGARDAASDLDLNDLVLSMRPLFEMHCVDLTFALEDELPSLRGDALQLRHALMNLVLNAIEAVRESGGAVEVSTGRYAEDPERVWVRVSDTGPGMGEEVLERACEPFYSTKEGAPGLGLAIVRWIAEEHDAELVLTSEAGCGTHIELGFPVSGSLPIEGSGTDREPERGSVLLVDDEDCVREAARRVLEAEGFSVFEAADGDEALETLAAGVAVDLVLLDLTMPGRDGASTLGALRARAPELAVLVMSGYAPDEVAAMVPLEDCSGFVRKPFRAEDLLGAVRAAVAER
ncbi:MAG TPA: response regulator [Planctomycetes bacterium]|nr:response regulator [Planctomycetota bacterium]